ncbi:MAG: FIST N-terminal domain-containing protein [Candidatus Paceibacterota bacterium]|jgi:hypothetical protein
MGIKAGVGVSLKTDSKQAGIEACNNALNGASDPGLMIVFCSVKHNQEEVVAGVREVSGKTPLIGCSSAGEITNEGVYDGSVAVMAIESDQMKVVLASGGEVKPGARQAGAKLAENLKSQYFFDSKYVLFLTDVLTGNGADVVRGMKDVLGKDYFIVGGAAGDDFLFKETYQYLNDKVLRSSVVGAGISGNTAVGVGVRHGWSPIGIPMKVTKSKGAVLEELDGKPALSIYEDYFGKKAEEIKKEPLARMAITYPLGMDVEGNSELLIRDPITVDEKGAITCAAEIPQGSEIRLMIGSKEDAIKAAKDAAMQAKEQLKGKEAKAVVIFDCIARKKLFGKDAFDEIKAIKSVLGENVPILGFYTYGEIAPLGGDVSSCNSSFHNETSVILALGE